MEGRLHPSAFSVPIDSFQQQQQQGELRLPLSTHQHQPTVHPYALIIDQQPRHLLADSSSLVSGLSSNSNANTTGQSPTPGVLVHASTFLKQENHGSPFDPQYGGSYSVERLLQQQASNVVDAKPTISPALLSAVDLVSSTQDPLQALHQRQQEQLAVAQQHLTLSASSLLTPARTALFHRQSDSPLAGLHSSLQPLLNTPPPPAIASPQLQQQRRTANAEIGPPLPQLNSLVRNIDRRLGGVLITPATVCAETPSTHHQQFADHQLIRPQDPQEGQSQQLNRFGLCAGAIISPTSLPASPSSCGGSEQQSASLELAAVKEGGPHFQVRPVSPLRGRGRPTVNPISDGSPRQHPCPECGKSFPNNSALVKHRLIHSDERNFVCNICQKAFKRQDHLNGHLNVHKTVKPFPCIVGNCDKSYCDARSLRRHLEHSHSVQNPVVHSSKGTVYIKCDDLEATVLPNRNVGEELDPVFNLIETSSGSTVPGQEYGPDQETYGTSADGSGEDQAHDSLVSPTLGLEQGRRSSSKPVECAQCGRTFKNMPALNGHMRLHSSISGRGEGTPKSFDEMSSKADQTALPVFVTPVGSIGHSGHSSSAPGSTPITGTSPVDAMLQQQRHQQALAQALAASTSAAASSTYQQHIQQQREQNVECEYGIHQDYRPTRPGPGLLMYAPSQQQQPSLHHSHSQPQHGIFHTSDAQVQTVHDYASPMSSRPPSHCSAHTMQGYLMDSKPEHDPQHQGQQSHQHNHGYASLLSVNTSALQEAAGGNESMLSGSDDPTMMSPHLASLTGLDVSASPELAMKASSGAGETGGATSMTAGPMAPMLAGPSVTDSPYCSSLRAEDVDASGQRPVSVDFGFPPSYAGVGMPPSSSGGHMGMHPGAHHHMASSMDGGGGAACHMEGPLDLGPELSKDVDDELIQKELLSFMRFPGPGDGMFNPFMNDDDEMLFSSGPAKLTERKRHMTAPSALALGAGAYSSAAPHYPGSSTQADHHCQYNQQQSSFVDYSSSQPGSILNSYEQAEALSSMNVMSDEGGQPSSNQFIHSSSSRPGGGDAHATGATGHGIGGGNHGNVPSGGNGKKSRPASRQRRKSRGKPDNVFMLLKSVGLRRSFNLPVSPPRFRKHSAAVVETGRKFSIGNGGGHHRGGGGGATTSKCHHRSGGSLQQRHSNRPKPAPLLIPGATLNRFHSQLRSPRLWVGGGLSGCVQYAKSGYSTPTPYTPPPILSPVRHGSGLFWTISKALAALAGAGPKSAPISPRFGRGFWPKALPPAPPSTDSQGGAAGVIVASGGGAGVVGDSISEGLYSGIVANSVRVSPLELGLTEETDEQPPATDTTPHINVGFQYQAEIPDFEPAGAIAPYGEYEKADLVFSPKVCEGLEDSEIDAYCKMASSIVATGGGRNVEYAMHLLNALNGDLERAYFTLLSPDGGRDALASVSSGCLSDYEYVDACLWSCEEIMKFYEAISKHDKDFFLISSCIGTKSLKQCVHFYYTWKKMCTDEYKRLRAARRRRILPAMALEPNVYDLRSLGPIETIVPSAAIGSPFTYDQQEVFEPVSTIQSKTANEEASRQRDEDFGNSASGFVVPTERNGSEGGMFNKSQYESEVEPLMKAYNGSPYQKSPATETGSTSDTLFPCRLCGKVFHKVKSRNAHMKSHSVGSAKKASPAPVTTASVALH